MWPVCATIRFLPLVAGAWLWCFAPLCPGWAVSGAEFSAGGQEPACPSRTLFSHLWCKELAGNPQQKQLKQHSWRAVRDEVQRVQELHGHSELKEWKNLHKYSLKTHLKNIKGGKFWELESYPVSVPNRYTPALQNENMEVRCHFCPF